MAIDPEKSNIKIINKKSGKAIKINFAKVEKLRSAFRYFDTNDNGYINFESVIEALKQNNVVIDEDKLKDVFCKYEKKGINFEEFKKIFYSNSNYKNNKN